MSHSTKDNLQVLYEDNHLIVINKRVGDIVQGDKTGDIPLSDIVKAYIKQKYKKPWECFSWCSTSIRQANQRNCSFRENLQSPPPT